MMQFLILPGDPLFDLSLATLPPGWQSSGNQPRFISRIGSCGLLEQVDQRTFKEYLYGGEFDARSEEIDKEDIFYFEI